MKTFSGRRASQREDELTAFIDLLKSEGVTSYLEIGARHGDTFHAIMSRLPAGSTGVAVDQPGAAWGTEASRPALLRAVEDLTARRYAASAVFGDSHALATREIVRRRGPYDAVLIDGDHTLTAVTADWLDYGSMARIVAFHDIDGNGQSDKSGRRVQVPALWHGLRESYISREIIGHQRGMGIGVIWRH